MHGCLCDPKQTIHDNNYVIVVVSICGNTEILCPKFFQNSQSVPTLQCNFVISKLRDAGFRPFGEVGSVKVLSVGVILVT